MRKKKTRRENENEPEKRKTKNEKRKKTNLLRPLPAHLHALEKGRQRRVVEDARVEDVDGVDQGRHPSDALEERGHGRRGRRGGGGASRGCVVVVVGHRP